MKTKPVKIISITPADKYKLTERKGNLYSQTLEVGKSMVITFKNTGLIRTTKIQEINGTESDVEVRTKNSVYTLRYQKEE